MPHPSCLSAQGSRKFHIPCGQALDLILSLTDRPREVRLRFTSKANKSHSSFCIRFGKRLYFPIMPANKQYIARSPIQAPNPSVAHMLIRRTYKGPPEINQECTFRRLAIAMIRMQSSPPANAGKGSRFSTDHISKHSPTIEATELARIEEPRDRLRSPFVGAISPRF